MNQRILARDETGLYAVRTLRSATAAGHVIQVLEPGTPSGTHRTWHADGRVHDRSTNPPSTTSAGLRPQPSDATNEGWVLEDLIAGQLRGRFAAVSEPPSPGAIVVDLVSGPSRQRIDVRYSTLSATNGLQDEMRAEYEDALLSLQPVEDRGMVRLVALIRLP